LTLFPYTTLFRSSADTSVHPYRGLHRGKRADLLFHEDGHEPPPGRVPAHGDRGRLRTLGKGPRPHDAQRLAHLRQEQPPVLPAERAAGVLRRRTRALTGLERWVLRSLGEEVRERRLQVP